MRLIAELRAVAAVLHGSERRDRRVEDEPHHQLPAAGHDPGGGPLAVRERRRDRVLQARPR